MRGFEKIRIFSVTFGPILTVVVAIKVFQILTFYQFLERDIRVRSKSDLTIISRNIEVKSMTVNFLVKIITIPWKTESSLRFAKTVEPTIAQPSIGQCNNVQSQQLQTLQCNNKDGKQDRFIMSPEAIREFSQVKANSLPLNSIDKKGKVQI